jgi:hypothetical protein
LVKPLDGLFGDTSELRLMHSLLPLKGLEFNITDLQSVSGLTRPVLTRVVKKFAAWDMLKVAYKHGNANFYELNTSSPFVILFQRLNSKVIEGMLEKEVLMDLHEHRGQRRNIELHTADISRPINYTAPPILDWASMEQEEMHITADLAKSSDAPRCTAGNALEGGQPNVIRAS